VRGRNVISVRWLPSAALRRTSVLLDGVGAMSPSPTGYSHTMRVVAGSNPLDLMPPTSNTVPGLSSTRLATGDQRIAPR
jgi:hypothetical protein